MLLQTLQLPDVKNLPSLQESHNYVDKHVLQLALHDLTQLEAVDVHVAHFVLSQSEQAPELTYF